MDYFKFISFSLILVILGSGGSLFYTWSQAEQNKPIPRIIRTDKLLSPQDVYRINSRTFNNTKISSRSIDVNNYSSNYSKQRVVQTKGDTKLFWVLNIETMEHYQINASLKVIGSHCLIYSNLSSSYDSSLEDMNSAFEITIYPIITTFFGPPPDIDNNNKTIILVFDIIDGYGGGQFVAGFFYSLNQYNNSDLNSSKQFSNEAEILHIDKLATDDFETVAHEFQHMIHFGHDNDENLWLDEGASMFAEYLIGEDPFSAGSYKSRFSSNPDVSLTYWDYDDSEHLVIANYGAAYAFFLYLAEHYGGLSIIQNIANHSSDGILSIEQALKNENYLVEFKEVFRNWTIANYLDDTSFANGAYGYYNTSLSMAVEHSYSTSSVPRIDNSVPYWGTDYLKFADRTGLPFTLEFQGEFTSDFMVTAILTNTTTAPYNTKVIPIEISAYEFGIFSTEALGISADEIVIAVSSYTPVGKNDHSDEEPAPAQTYCILVNPLELTIIPGNLTLLENGDILIIWNITVFDTNGIFWKEADGAIYEIQTEFGISTGIAGNLTYNPETNIWEAREIIISALPEGSYYVRYHFFNNTSSGIAYSEIFSVITPSSSQPSSSAPESSSKPSSSAPESSSKPSSSAPESSTHSSVNITITTPSIELFLVITVLIIVSIVKKKSSE